MQISSDKEKSLHTIYVKTFFVDLITFINRSCVDHGDRNQRKLVKVFCLFLQMYGPTLCFNLNKKKLQYKFMTLTYFKQCFVLIFLESFPPRQQRVSDTVAYKIILLLLRALVSML